MCTKAAWEMDLFFSFRKTRIKGYFVKILQNWVVNWEASPLLDSYGFQFDNKISYL